MAEHSDHSNNGQTPFRRYSPPANAGKGQSQPSRVTPFPRPAQGDGAGRRSASRRDDRAVQSRLQRSARQRWRQWLQPHPPEAPPEPPAKPMPTPLPEPRSPEAPSGRPGTLPPPRTASPPPQGQGIPQPSPLVTRQGQGHARRLGHTPDRGFPSASLKPPLNAPPARPGSEKVTPLRRQPVWSTPPEPPSSGAKRERKSPPRRRTNRAPRPVLYGVRLLILGIGMAAIAGTLLSMMNPERQGAAVPSNLEAATPPPSASRSRAPAGNLPVGAELTYLETALMDLEALTPGLTQAVFLLDLDTGNFLDINGAVPISAASTIKVPILVAFLEAVDAGSVSLDQAITLEKDQIVGGSGEMQYAEPGTRYTALEVATEMIVTSDNTATNLIINLLGGSQALNQKFQQWGLSATVLRNPLPDLEGTNTTSPKDLVRILAGVDQGELLSLRSRDRLWGIMQRTMTRSLIPEGVGDGEALIFNKTGDIGMVLGDVALVDTAHGKRYLISVLVNRSENDGRASELIRRISGAVYKEMNQRVAPVGGTPAPSPEVPPTEDGSPEPSLTPTVPQG